MIRIKKYEAKLLEELSLLSDEIIDLGLDPRNDPGNYLDSNSIEFSESAFFLTLKNNDSEELIPIKALVQMKASDNVNSSEKGLVFTYSVLLKKVDPSSEVNILKLLESNWDLTEVFLWPMEINDEWFLLGSIKKTFESYLPGQIKNHLLSIMDEVCNLDF